MWGFSTGLNSREMVDPVCYIRNAHDYDAHFPKGQKRLPKAQPAGSPPWLRGTKPALEQEPWTNELDQGSNLAVVG